MEKELTDSHRIEREAADRLARRDAGGWSVSDQAGLEAWLVESTAHRVAWLRLEATWRESRRLKALAAGLSGGTFRAAGHLIASPCHSPEPADAEAAGASFSLSGADEGERDATRSTGDADLATLAFAPRGAEKSSRVPGLGAVATVAALAVALAWSLHWHVPATPAVVYGTSVGVLETASLADGSEAVLSSDSRIMVAMSPGRRDIDLQRGEAIFHAAKDPSRPFVVAAEGHRAVAVGTRFAVRRDPDGIRVVVTEGLVRLESEAAANGQPRPVTLLPAGSVAMATRNGVVVRTGSIDDAMEALSWRDGFLAFHDTPLATAAAEFNRFSNRRIVIDDPAVGALRVGGNFRWSNSEGFVRLLEQGFPVRADYRVDSIVLHSR